MPKIVIRNGDKKGLSLQLSNQEVSMGRSADNTIVLSDRRVSRVHARIFPQGKDYVLEDLGSVNGTTVNKEPINKKVLVLNDEIVLGSTHLIYVSSMAPENVKDEKAISKVTFLPDEQEPKNLTVELKLAADRVSSIVDELDEDDIRALQKAYQRLIILYQVSDDLGRVVDLADLLDRMLKSVLNILKADRGLVMLHDEDSDELILQAARQRDGLDDMGEITCSRTVTNYVFKSGESILTTDAKKDDRLKEAQSIVLQGIKSIMCVPVKTKDKVLGVMQIDTKGQAISFTKDDLELMTAICNQTAVAIDNAQLFEGLKRANKELKEQQNQLIEAEKLSAVGQLASGVAHEINNPMTSILGYAELTGRQLSKDEITEEKRQEFIENLKIIEGEANRCQNIVQSLLSFSRRKKDQKVPTDINQVVEASLAIAKFHIKGAQIEIVKQLASDLPSILADQNQLQQVFLNFIVNARDAIGSKGKLTITTKKSSEFIEVEFADTGCGIPADKLEEIFKPLYTSKEEGKGTGLGLSISQDIVESHQGSIEIESEEGVGTTFTIKLPIKIKGSE